MPSAPHPRFQASLAALDEHQRACVLTDDESALVRAPVGSGKTTVLVHRVLYLHLVRGVPLGSIAVLTFTNKAAAEIRARVEALVDRPPTAEDFRLTGTFHGVARALLARALPVEQLGYRPDFGVIDEDAREALLDRLIAEHRLRIRHRPRLRKRLHALANGAAPTEERTRDDLARLAALYDREKRAANQMDFDDLIANAITLLDEVRESGGFVLPRFLVVDEMQDCEPRELAFLARLRGPGTGFFAVGDPHQAIYGWRGSAPEVFARVEADFACRPHALPWSYRSTETIIEGARHLLGLQPAAGGALVPVRGPGERIVLRRHHDPTSEAIYLGERLAQLHQSGVPWEQMAILYRLRAQSEALRGPLIARGIPCAGGDDEDGDPRGVRLLTLHAAKGLEFRHVFLSGINKGILPLGHRRDAAEDAEERRLLFVGITRARDAVEISYHARPDQPGAVGDLSPYLEWIPAALLDWRDGVQSAPVAPAPVVAPIAAAAPDSSGENGFRTGQRIRHARYGVGVVVRVGDGGIECDFGKMGVRAFPVKLCPIVPVEGAAA